MDEELVTTEMQDEIDFVEVNAETIVSDLIQTFEENIGEKLYPADERRLYLLGFGYALADQLVHINETGRGNLLRYAEDVELDGIGDLYNNSRLEAGKATTTIQFTLATVPTEDIFILKGTRVTPDGEVFFATDEDLVFNAKTTELSKTVSATATESGSNHNDFMIGQINKLVDGNSYVKSVTNTTPSSGGTDIESDEDYKERLRLSPFKYSVAGPANSYRLIALSSSNDVGDVSVYSPSAGVVEIAIVKRGGEVPEETDSILTTVLNACSADEVRPLTDKVQVVPAVAVTFDLAVTYYVANNDLSKLADITSAVEEYVTWQTEKIARDINPDMLRNMMINAGAARVDITGTGYTGLEKNEIAKKGTITVTYGGSIKS